MSAEERIVVGPKICSGKPCIRGTRIMVKNILGMLAGGYSLERIIRAYPELVLEDVSAALDYASQVIDEEKVIVRS
ncbi:MAG: DUF433 domain-containing protein [Dehalococcoidia bacterium]|nr:DUF433 domain-containing protein [Dehalococcoidia bacterium]MSQ16578.1 DUF433 domain-containing protein [Dehalococcoidia bacterium]